MTLQEDALTAITSFLEHSGVPYMVIGGIANLVWGEPRATLDIDITVLVPSDAQEAFIQRVGREYRILVPNPGDFVRDTRVLPVEARSGIRIDLVFGLLPFEEDAVRRAVSVATAARSIRVCTAEDLIIMKIISDRPQDIADARAIVRRRFRELDLDYLEPRIAEIATLLERSEIQSRWDHWKSET
jgi:hypothetical protein